VTAKRPVTSPRLRERQKEITVALLKEAARKVFYAKAFDNVSMDNVAAEAGVGRSTVYLHFSSKIELLLSILNDDLIDGLALYSELATMPKVDHASLKAWLHRYNDVTISKRTSTILFRVAGKHSPNAGQMLAAYYKSIIERLAQRFPALNPMGLPYEEGKRREADIYMILFQIERVCDTFSAIPGMPDIDTGLDILATKLLEFFAGKQTEAGTACGVDSGTRGTSSPTRRRKS